MPRKAPFRVYMEKYLARLQGKEENTQQLYLDLLNGIWRTANQIGLGRRSPRCWTLERIIMLVNARRTKLDGSPRANASIRQELSLLNRFLKYCGNLELDQALEFGDVRKPPETYTNRRWLSLEDIIRLRVEARESGDHLTLMAIQIGLDAYLRVSEMADLHLSDIQGTTIKIRLGKGRKDREVSITQRTRLDLENYISGPRAEMLKGRSTPYLFAYMVNKRTSSPYRPSSIAHRVRKIGRRCEPSIEVSPHDLRRSGAQLTYISNPTDKTVRDLQAALGHRSMEQTREYIGTAVVDQQATFRTRDRYLAKLYPEEFSQG